MMNFKDKIVYQIYPKSFKDTNGNGVGDLRGVIEKLDYIKELGADYIWLTPFYCSPQKDNGYDISDYYNIDPMYGTMDDFEELSRECKKRGIDLMLDMVFNHTSTEHEWFKRALKGEKKYKDYYIFKKGKANGEPPTNWESKFGGNAWEYVEELGEYYLHLFDVTQADLNWDNPELREEIYKVVNFWIDKGVRGFRLDVINLISKESTFEDDNIGDGRRFYTDGPNIHKYLKELNENTFGRDENIITVGEMSSTTIENCLKYSNPDEKELSMVFNFHHLKVDYINGNKWDIKDFDFMELKELFNKWQTEMINGNGCTAVFWCNHDQQRINSRFCDVKNYHRESSTMLANAIHLMSGVPYIYQGEEIGMTNPEFTSISQYVDVESINFFNMKKEEGVDEEGILDILRKRSRDNSRTPMQWDESENSGFTEGKPWISLSPNYKDINVKKALSDNKSIYYYYKKLIEIRKSEAVIRDGDYKLLLKDNDKVYAYERSLNNERIISVNNFYGEECIINLADELKHNGNFDILISNYYFNHNDLSNIKLRPYEAFAIKLK
ncbi:alpha,alpha-phosphotrehalase [Clostridium paraputrificum]|uniref:alpha,alpha-phosphotrehalase n=1 Tax=Clostridium paraputrificum TaxID=29363 RepID=UPI0018A0E556|nr:alpha,alpha-phosphotrehalase [Clostridium paraputrificum]MDB2117468.1 alpha,alpha-phosphotrehalase [Clostridium paraputrificum]MDU4787449.1 alpha,alpha-phosphotrehalase [Clostridium sp.]